MAATKSSPPLTMACGESITTVMIGHFVTRLEVEAGKAGGLLGAEEIRIAAEHFLAHEMASFQSTFQRAYDECTQRRDEQRWSGIRRQPFDRILMKKFAHLFPARKGDDGSQGILSRRIVPGFNLAVDKMIGPMLYEQCQRKMRAIMDRHTNPSGCDWKNVYADAETILLANDVLLVVAHYFAEFDRRRAWFLDLVNSHLANPAGADDADAHWQLTVHGFAELMRALFDNLSEAMRSRPANLKARYGEHTVTALEKFLARLELEA